MGWFLKGDKRKTQAKRSSAAGRKSRVDRKPWDPKRTLAGLKMMGALVLVAAAGVGWWHAREALGQYVERHASQAVEAEQIVLVDLPRWMNPQAAQDLRVLAARQISAHPLDVQSLQAAHEALSQNAWIQQVVRLERQADGQIHVKAIYRQPLAMVEHQQACYLIDTQGVRLPGVYPVQQASQLPLPVLRGVAAEPVMEGLRWPGDDVQAGLALARELAAEPYRHQVEAIDVAGRDSRGRIHLAILTGQGGLVRWGLPPGQEQSVEPPASTKRAWLAQLVRQNGHIDAGGKVVDLYRAAVFVHLRPEREIGSNTGYTFTP